MIRKININDIETINYLGTLYVSKFNNVYDLKYYIDNPNYIVNCYEELKEIKGFIICDVVEDAIEIQLIYVKENCRCQHIGTKLLQNLQVYKKAKILLEVSKENQIAYNLYRNCGFEVINIRKGYYHGIDAYVMEKKMKDVNILAIETTCDETSIAIVKNGHECVALTILTQMDTHALYGGVVPEIASRMHAENITMVLDDVLKKANMKVDDVDAIAVSYKPGLMGSLLVGVEFAKVLSYICNKPLIGVNHLVGHIYANNLEDNLEYPLLALVVSGGHTELAIMKNDYDFELLGSTLDDAIGESFDKVARVLGYPYPGGPSIEKAAKEGNNSYTLPVPVADNTYNFSYSGLKSHIINLVNSEKMKNNPICKEDLACSFQTAAVEELSRKLKLALENTSIKRVVIAGGVSANSYLRSEIKKACDEYQAKLYIPRMLYCTDNAAMIGAAAYPLYLRKDFKDLDLNAQSSTGVCDLI